MDCLEIFDKQQQQQQSHGRPGSSSHAQSRRFLDPKWQGLPDGPCEEPLRPLVEEMASGASVLDIVQRSTSSAAVAQLVHWLSGFKLVRCVSRIGGRASQFACEDLEEGPSSQGSLFILRDAISTTGRADACTSSSWAASIWSRLSGRFDFTHNYTLIQILLLPLPATLTYVQP